MRQVINVAFADLAEGLEPDGVDELLAELEAAPGERPRRKAKVDPGLLNMLGPGA